MDPPFTKDAAAEDTAGLRQAMEYYADQGWTDGLPVVPVTESYLAPFLAQAGRDPDDVLLDMPHLNRALTVRLAAINAALSSTRPPRARRPSTPRASRRTRNRARGRPCIPSSA